MSDDKNFRHRFTVPCDDTVVNTWIENQSNLGFSLRVLIKDFVRTYGNKDATCVEFGTAVKRRGRPPKQLKNLMNQMDSTSGEYDDDEDATYEEQDAIYEVPQENEAPKETPSPKKQSKPEKPEESANKGSTEDQLMTMFKGHDFTGKKSNVPVSSDGSVDFDELMDN